MKYFSITNLNQVYYIEVLKACFIIGLLRNSEGFRSGDKFVSLLELSVGVSPNEKSSLVRHPPVEKGFQSGIKYVSLVSPQHPEAERLRGGNLFYYSIKYSNYTKGHFIDCIWVNYNILI
jgi:hypothetical protein